jgi:hypothetical protein
MRLRPPFQPLSAVLLGGLLAGAGAVPLLPAPSQAQGSTSPSAVQLQALEAALNASDDAPLAALLQAGPGLAPDQLRQRRQLLRQQFPDLKWQVRSAAVGGGQPTVNLRVSGTRVQAGVTYHLDAQQSLILRSDGRHLSGQTLLAESSILRSGDQSLPVVLQIPDAVLTGQSYDVDLILDEPLDGALVAGGLAAITAQQVAAMESPPLELGALGGGGLFKTVRAPLTPGSQTWALLMVHPRGVISATKRVRVVADRRALER